MLHIAVTSALKNNLIRNPAIDNLWAKENRENKNITDSICLHN